MTEETLKNPTMAFKPVSNDCQSLFSLKRSNSSSTAPFIQIDFSLPQALKEDPFFTSINLIPTFNLDRKFYTPSFILGSQSVICYLIGKEKYLANDQGYRMIHNKKIQEMEEQKAVIFVPKPSKANSYCCICRQPFEDYLTHINIPRHGELMKNSVYYSMIEDLCGNSKTESADLTEGRKENKKTEKSLYKKKKIFKISQLVQKEKRVRGRPRKTMENKMQMLVSIPTNVSISV